MSRDCRGRCTLDTLANRSQFRLGGVHSWPASPIDPRPSRGASVRRAVRMEPFYCHSGKVGPNDSVGLTTADSPDRQQQSRPHQVSTQDHVTGAGLRMAGVSKGTRCIYISVVSVVLPSVQWSQCNSFSVLACHTIKSDR